MKPSYKKAIEFIALNDESKEMNIGNMVDLISVVLVADLFGKDPLKVASDVIKFREKSSDN